MNEPGMAKRLFLYAETVGIPTRDPSEVIPLIIMQGKAERNRDALLILGLSNVISTAFGKGSMDPWLDQMYPKDEREKGKRASEKEKALQTEMAMAMKMRMLSDRFEIREVRE